MGSYLDDVLKKLGWEDGFQIPVANTENRELEEEVARLTLQKVRTKNASETASLKLQNLTGHFKHVQEELAENQRLLTAYDQQLKIEGDNFQVSTKLKEKTEQEIRQYDKENKETSERIEVKKQQLLRCVSKVDKLKLETNWDSEALKAWDESLQKRDQDNELIKKFSKEDERRYNELEARRKSLETDLMTKKQTMGKMVAELTNYEMVLERTGKVMQEQIVERNALIQQWKEAVAILHQRDNDIERLKSQVEETHELIEKQKIKLDEQNHFYENEIRNNEQIKLESQDLNLLNSRRRRELIDLIQHISLLNGEVDSLRKMMIGRAKELEKERGNTKVLAKEIERRGRRIEKYREQIKSLKRKLEELQQSTQTAVERTKELDDMIKLEEKHYNMLLIENETLQLNHFRTQQQLEELIKEAKILENTISGFQTSMNHLRKRTKDTKSDVSKIKEVIYDMDYKIEELQRKIFDKENPHDVTDNNKELEMKVKDLESKLAEYTEVKNMLNNQVNKIQEDMRRLTAAVANDESLQLQLKDKLQHQVMSFEGGQKQTKSFKLALQEKQVEENVFRLRVNYVNNVIKKEEHNICNLQKFRLNLEQRENSGKVCVETEIEPNFVERRKDWIIKPGIGKPATMERLLEINTNKDILQVKKRNLAEDRGRLRCDLAERQLKLDHLKKKYDVIVMSFGTDDSGQALSLTHVKIKNSQEKFFLQEEGDKLDGKIKKAEQEIVAMENTLKLVNVTNAAFKKSLGVVEEHDEEMSEMKELNEQLAKLTEILAQRKKALVAKRTSLAEKRNALDKVQSKNQEEKDLLNELETDFVRSEQEHVNKEETLRRTEDCLKKVATKLSTASVEKYDRNLEIKQLREANSSAKQRLVEMAARYAEITPLINRYMIEYEVKLPEKATFSTSSSSRSTISCRKLRYTRRESTSFSSSSANLEESSGPSSGKSNKSSSSVSTVVLTFTV